MTIPRFCFFLKKIICLKQVLKFVKICRVSGTGGEPANILILPSWTSQRDSNRLPHFVFDATPLKVWTLHWP